MLSKLAGFNRSALFWWLLILLCVGLEAGALFYQFVLGDDPCVLCVHVRAWVLGIGLAAALGLLLRKSWVGLMIANLVTLGFAAGLLERSYQVLGAERGFTDGVCSMNANFPAWLPLDQWLPAVFKPLESCGFTPWVIPDLVSMAEVLIVVAVGLALVMLVMLLSSFKPVEAD